MGAFAILSTLGASSNFSWTASDLRQKCVAHGSDQFMQVAGDILAELGLD